MRSFRLLGAAVAACAAVGAVPATAGATAALHPTKQLKVATVSVTTSTGTSVRFAFQAGHGTDVGNAATVGLSNAVKGYALLEDHEWTLPITGSSISFNKGKGSFDSGTQFGHYGAVSLTFTKVSQTSKSCSGDNNLKTTITNVKVALKGTVNFHANSTATTASAWGTVTKGTSAAPYKFGGAYGHYVTTTNGLCDSGVTPPTSDPTCMQGVSWAGPFVGSATGFRVVTGDSTTSPKSILAFRDQGLSSPANAERLDVVVAAAPAPTLDTTDPNAATLSVTTKPGTAASGSGVLTATSAGTAGPTWDCDPGAAPTATQHETDYDTANFANGATPLTVQSNVGSDLALPDDSSGTSQFSTFSYA